MAETFVGKSDLGEDLSDRVKCESYEEMGPRVGCTCPPMLTAMLRGPRDETTYTHPVIKSEPDVFNFDDDEPANADSALSYESTDVASDGKTEDVKIAAGVPVRDSTVYRSGGIESQK